MARFERDISDPENITLTVNLDEVFGQEFPDDDNLKLQVAQDLIDMMVDRTQNQNITWTGKKFAPYSKEYKASDEYAIWKSSNDPNLTLRDEMLNSIDAEIDGQQIILKFTDATESAKAHGHITNHNGLWDEGNSPVKNNPRDFWGFTDSEFRGIVAEYEDIIRTETETVEVEGEQQTSARDIFRQALISWVQRQTFTRGG